MFFSFFLKKGNSHCLLTSLLLSYYQITKTGHWWDQTFPPDIKNIFPITFTSFTQSNHIHFFFTIFKLMNTVMGGASEGRPQRHKSNEKSGAEEDNPGRDEEGCWAGWWHCCEWAWPFFFFFFLLSLSFFFFFLFFFTFTLPNWFLLETFSFC